MAFYVFFCSVFRGLIGSVGFLWCFAGFHRVYQGLLGLGPNILNSLR